MMHKGCGKMCGVHMVAWWLLIIGGLNWGLIGAVNYNVVGMIFGSIDWLERLIYVLVGIAAIAMLFKSSCKQCMNACHKEGMGSGSGEAKPPMGGMPPGGSAPMGGGH